MEALKYANMACNETMQAMIIGLAIYIVVAFTMLELVICVCHCSIL